MSTLQQKLKNTKYKKPETEPVTAEGHQEVVELLRGQTMEMSFTIHGLPKSRRISGKAADQLAASVKGNKRGVRGSWSMFSSEHPAVKNLNAAIRDIIKLRDDWTIVKSAEVKTGEGDKTTIAGGKRLIWDKQITEFYALFVKAAERIDLEVGKLQEAMDNTTYDAEDNPIDSIKSLDRENAGDAWDPSVYPEDLSLVVGVAKERDPTDGTPVLDAEEKCKYIIDFKEYHVSEKLPELLRERAIQRIDEGLSATVETAMTYTVNELSESMLTFLGELQNRMKIYPRDNSPYKYMTQHGEAEVIKSVTSDEDSRVAAGHIKVYVRYVTKDDAGEQKVSKWIGPMRKADFQTQMCPQTTGEKRKIYPGVIEGIIAQLQSFKEHKARMLGQYGTNLTAAFEPLLELLTKAKEGNPFVSNDNAAQKLAAVLRTDTEVKDLVAKAVTDTVEALEEQVVSVKTVQKRRSIKMSLAGALGD